MPCTTILVGKKASNDNSTMIARTDDGHFDVKKMVLVTPKDQKKKYKSVISHLEIELPDNPMSYTACPSVDPEKGIWAATGINEANVGMTATETITSNPRVLAADPLVEYKKSKSRLKKDTAGGIGEEDIVSLVLPYIHTAREGVLRLASLLEMYGTYESNGIAFNDGDEIWWMETIGGHHWMARRVPDDHVVLNPNQFGMDHFDIKDALTDKKEHMCSADLEDFIRDNYLDLNQEGRFNPRDIFGSHTDMDHIYNTPRAWFMARCLTPLSRRFDSADSSFTPESDDLPWALVPDRKLAVEDVKYLLSSHYQGTDYNPYSSIDTGKRGKYRSIGINRTGVTGICQIRDYVDDAIKGVFWLSFGSTTFSCMMPVYTKVSKLPAYISNVTLDTSTENLYWSSRLIGALADPHYPSCVQDIERYHNAVMTKSRAIMQRCEKEMAKSADYSTVEKVNEEIAKTVRELTTETLGKVLGTASAAMKNGFNLADN